MNFDTGVADRLIGACRDAARTLQDQRDGREAISTAALTEFRLVHGQGVPNLITNKGVVWDGNNPIYRDEFEQHYYRGPDDDKINGAINSVEEGNILMGNHNLIASNSENNMKALENMLGIVTR